MVSLRSNVLLVPECGSPPIEIKGLHVISQVTNYFVNSTNTNLKTPKIKYCRDSISFAIINYNRRPTFKHITLLYFKADCLKACKINQYILSIVNKFTLEANG